MKLQTQLSLKKQPFHQVDYQSKLLLLGSCFSENIGDKLVFYKFQSLVNPLGILFHPKAIENLILNAINLKKYTEKDLFFHNERWHSFEAHSKLSNPDKNELLNSLNNVIQQTNQQLHHATHIFITLGTAWVYRFIEEDVLVANCHKVPQKKFLKELLSVDEIAQSLAAITTLIKNINPIAKVIFTVSPVRHLKDGFIENQQSKAHLISAVHQVIETPPSKVRGLYFPAYEIMMDELRDYRFYAADMIHPNKTAINYIWEKFTQVWISKKAQETMKIVENIQKGLVHRPFNANSKQHQQFLKTLEEKKKLLQKKHPFITF